MGRTRAGTMVALVLCAGVWTPFVGAPSLVAQVSTEAPARLAEVVSTERERAVRLARAGSYAEALEILRRLHAAEPSDVGLRADLVAVLSWAGRDAEAFELGGHLPFHTLPPVVSEAVARSARNLDRPVFAAGLYEEVIHREADRIESQIGFALSLLEAGELERALTRVPVLQARFPDEPQARIATGHVFSGAGQPVEAAVEYRIARGLSPEEPEPYQAEARSLRDFGGALLALELLRENPEAFPPPLHADLLAGHAARYVDWASVVPESRLPEDRFSAADRALEVVDAALLETRSLPPSEVGFPERRLRFDRLVALRERREMAAVREGVRELESEGVVLPPYVLRHRADAELALGNPQGAVRWYREALDGWPGQPEATLGLFYALVESWRFQEADSVLAAFIGNQPERRAIAELDTSLSNPERLDAVVARHLGQAFAGDLPGAQAAFEELHRRAPMNLDVRQELASVYLWRGWPGRSLEMFDRITALDPEHIGARVGKTSAALAMDELGTAQALADTLGWAAPESEHARRVLRRVAVLRAWEFSARAGKGWSTGGELGTRDHSLRTRLLSPPVGHRIRGYLATSRADAAYPDGRGAHDRVSAGLELWSRPLFLSIGVDADRDGAEAPGVSGRGEYRPGDRWTFEVAGGSRSPDVPLRAARDDIRGWLVRAGVGRRAHEGRRWNAEVARLEMEDGNRRSSAYLALEQQFLRTPRHRFALLGEGYAARNSREDAPYFNPAETVSTTGSVLWDWTLHSRLERSYAQRLTVTGGVVTQDEVTTRAVTVATLEHRWEMSAAFEVHYGVHWGLPVYDGIRERRTSIHGGLAWRIR